MKVYGLIGKSLFHSWSKDYFEQKFARENISGCTYRNFPLEDISSIRQLVAGNTSILGLNVTIPYKSKVIEYLDSLDRDAAAVRAVNCIRVDRLGDGDFTLKGFNTDFLAFEETLKPLVQGGIHKALILGTGGASKAICYALDRLGIDHDLVSRRKSGKILVYSEITPDLIGGYQLIVNTTPVGMAGEFEGTYPPLPYSALGNRHLLYDLVYNPEITPFLEKGMAMGCRTINGMEMLKLQAELSWTIWNA